jgi:hypothetical protein
MAESCSWRRFYTERLKKPTACALQQFAMPALTLYGCLLLPPPPPSAASFNKRIGYLSSRFLMDLLKVKLKLNVD